MVKRALLLMQQRIDTPLSVTEIARQMGSSKRQLERHFRAALDTSPQAAFLDIRLSFARHLLEATDKSISTIAVECGFCNSSHLSRMFRPRYTARRPNRNRPGGGAAIPVGTADDARGRRDLRRRSRITIALAPAAG